MITREQILALAGGEGLDGKDHYNSGVWHRSWTTGPRLSRWVGWFELEVWQASKARPDVSFRVRCGHSDRLGQAENWETAMSAAEDTLRGLLTEIEALI